MNEIGDIAVTKEFPAAGLLSNGRYHVLVTESGRGYSALGDFALTRWRPLPRPGAGGTFLYIQDLESAAIWSAMHEPTRRRADHYETWLGPGCFHVRRSDDGIEVHTEVRVAPNAPAEIRRHTFTNRSSRRRRLRITSYAEPVMQRRAVDASHPAFSKLFVETEFVPEIGGVLARRRPQDPDERFPLLLHAFVLPSETALEALGSSSDSDKSPPPDHAESAAAPGESPSDSGGRRNVSGIHYETDRAAFIGRGRNLTEPLALSTGDVLADTAGAVLDPVLSVQTEIVLEPGQEKELIFVSAAGYSKEEVIGAAARFRGAMTRAEAFLEAGLRDQQARDKFSLGPKNADRYHRLGAAILGGDTDLRLPPAASVRESGEVTSLQSLSMDSTRPLVLGRVADEDELAVARLLLKARDYWHTLGFRTRVVLLNDKSGSEADELQRRLKDVIAKSSGGHDNVVLRHSDSLDDDLQRTIQSRARLVVNGDRVALLRVPASDDDLSSENETSLENDVPLKNEPPLNEPPSTQTPTAGLAEPRDVNGSNAAASPAKMPQMPAFFDADALQMYNGFGGFSEDGSEYVIHVLPTADGHLRLPPMPWVNVVANEAGGFLVSELGSGYTWHENSRENRLTPWSNDPVLDPAGEALYIRDEESGDVWSPTPGPAPSGAPVEVRHGIGYTSFRQSSWGLDQRVTMFMPKSDPVKIIRLDVTNTGSGPRHLTLASLARWVLGPSDESAGFVVTAYDEESGALTATNPHNEPYQELTAFAALLSDGDIEEASHTGSCRSFLGENGDPANPAGLGGGLDGRTGAGLDPCGACAVRLRVDPGESRSFFSLLGQVRDSEDIPDITERYGSAAGASNALDEVRSIWADITSRIQISTPSPEIDLMVNGWLPYQNLSCRLLGRSAFYQSGGAYGFRDQLQDAAAFSTTSPRLVHDQILLHAAHQFEEGDVMHWWHPPRSRGIRTRFSDDLLWLPYVVLDYLEATGNRGILDEKVPYLTARELAEGEDEIFVEPTMSSLEEPLFLHCCRALDRSLSTGSHGLPLIGSGDWNDGMNRVGRTGGGESVWLGFFLYDILRRFIPLCEERTEMERVDRYRTHLEHLERALNDAGWDGQWYRRAFYDNGEPIGSAQSQEGKIDAVVQAWSVLSGAAPSNRARMALDSMEEHLVSEKDGIIRLLTPPFDRTDHDPGYIKGYLPGVRENGGQYTHAALWAVKALAEDGRCERAAPLLAMLSPVSHTRSSADLATYKVEPYVVAADVYGAPPHVGRGGWTWYTGSAGWMYRVAVESILGFRLVRGDEIEIKPCIPGNWDHYSMHYRHPGSETEFEIRVDRSDSVLESPHSGQRTSEPSAGHGHATNRVVAIDVNGSSVAPQDGVARLPIAKDGKRYRVAITIGA